MIHPIPSGTRDVLPDEMRELRAITEARARRLRARTATARSTRRRWSTSPSCAARRRSTAPRPAYRLFDEHGDVLVLRSDMTVPIARVVATRYATAEPPLRFCYFAHAYRGVRPQRGQSREFLQAGIELVGAPAPEGDGRGAAPCSCAALDASGLQDYRIGVGDASLYPALLGAFGVPERARARLLHELVARDFVGLEREVDGGSACGGADGGLLLRAARSAAGPRGARPARPGRRRERGGGACAPSTSCWPSPAWPTG